MPNLLFKPNKVKEAFRSSKLVWVEGHVITKSGTEKIQALTSKKNDTFVKLLAKKQKIVVFYNESSEGKWINPVRKSYKTIKP